MLYRLYSSVIVLVIGGGSLLTFAQEKKQIDSITLRNEIETVAILGKKKLIERKVDRTVFNVENSIAAQGTDLTEALRNTPMVRINEQTGISIAGKGSVAIMVNDKILNISGEELMNYLKSLRSDNVARIEVITTPPSKYEAQGNSGLINIVLKKNPNLGLSGNLSTALNQMHYTGTSNNLNINYQTEKLSVSVKVRHSDIAKKSTENLTFFTDKPIYSSDLRKDMFKGPGGNFSVDYKLSRKSSIGAVYDIGQNDRNLDILNTSRYFSGSRLDSVLITKTENRNRILSHTLSAYYDYNFDDKGKKMSLSGNYFSNVPKYTVDFVTANAAANASDIVRNLSYIDYKIWSGQLDFTLPFSFGTIETGAKFTNFKNDSDVRYLNFLGSDFIIDPVRSNLFNYTEKNYALYGSFSRELSDKWALQAGMRYEYAVVDGYSPTTGETNKIKYGQFFPTGYVSYKPDVNNTFSLSYSRRINRPGFRAINPFRWYSNPYTFYSGNPSLRPSYSNNLELGYVFKGNLSATAYWQKTTDGFSQVVLVDGHSRWSTFYNYFEQNSCGLSLNYNLKPVKIWESNIGADMSNSKVTVKSDVVSPILLTGLTFSYNINNTVTLNKQKTAFLLLNLSHQLPWKENNTDSKGRSYLNAGLKLSFMEKSLQINALINDIFKQARSRGKMLYESYEMHFDNYYNYQGFTLSATYNFGNAKVKGTNRIIKFDEKNRAN